MPLDFRSVDQVKHETKQRIRHEAAKASTALRPLLKRIAEEIFEDSCTATALRREVRPSKAAEKEFRKQLGVTLARYIKVQRLITAQQLLERTNLPVCEVAKEVQAATEGHFSTIFRDWAGQCPSEIRAGAASKSEPPDLDHSRQLWFSTHLGIATPHQGREIRHITNVSGGADRELQERFIRATVECLEEWLPQYGLDTVRAWCHQRDLEPAFCQALFEALSERSRLRGREHRRKGLELAELALALIKGNAERLGDAKAEFLGLAWARLGNARRLASDLEGAATALCQAEQWGGKSASGEIFLHWGSLRLFQRGFAEADRYLREALIESRASGNTALEVDVLQQRAVLLTYRGEPEAAIVTLRDALRLTPRHDVRCRLISVQHLIVIRALLDHHEHLAELLPEARRLVARIDEKPGRLQICWAEGLVARRRGDCQEAVDRLKEAREGFAELEDTGMQAIVSLDLALLYNEQGDTAHVLEHSSEALPALEALNLPEALGALELLRQALSERNIERRLLESTRYFLLTA